MKYTELQTTINNLKIKSKKKLVEALNNLLKEEGFKAVEHWDKSNSAYVTYKGQTAFYVDGEKWECLRVVIRSANNQKYKVRHSSKSWDYSLVPAVTDTDQDKKRIERYLDLQDLFKKSPFEYSYYWGDNDRTIWTAKGTKAFTEMKERLHWRKYEKEGLEKASIPYEVGYYLKSLERLADDRTKKTQFLEEMPKAYSKVLEIIANENQEQTKRYKEKCQRVKDFIAERKTYKAF